jgi:DNA-binding transcriptional regulator YhcF (GntR family)
MVSIRDAMPSYVRQAYEEVERQQRISSEVESGEFVRVVGLRKANGIKYVGRVGEVLKAEKSGVDLDDLNWNSVILEREVSKAIEKAKKLETEKVEVKKAVRKKPDGKEIIIDVIHGRVKGYDAVRRLIENAES